MNNKGKNAFIVFTKTIKDLIRKPNKNKYAVIKIKMKKDINSRR